MTEPGAGPAGSPRRTVFIVAVCIAVTIIPLLIFLGYSLYQSYTLQSGQRLEQRIFGARLAAATVAAELNSIREFGASRCLQIRDRPRGLRETAAFITDHGGAAAW